MNFYISWWSTNCNDIFLCGTLYNNLSLRLSCEKIEYNNIVLTCIINIIHVNILRTFSCLLTRPCTINVYMKSLRIFEFRALFPPHKQIITHNRIAFESRENEVRRHMYTVLAWNRGKTAITRTLYRVDGGECYKDRFAEAFQLPYGQKHCSGVLLPCTYVSSQQENLLWKRPCSEGLLRAA